MLTPRKRVLISNFQGFRCSKGKDNRVYTPTPRIDGHKEENVVAERNEVLKIPFREGENLVDFMMAGPSIDDLIRGEIPWYPPWLLPEGVRGSRNPSGGARNECHQNCC